MLSLGLDLSHYWKFAVKVWNCKSNSHLSTLNAHSHSINSSMLNACFNEKNSTCLAVFVCLKCLLFYQYDALDWLFEG